jgi:hypothetical protein
MDRNSSHLADLFKILRLNLIDQPEDEQSSQRYFDTFIYLTDQEIFDHATLHDLPICLSIDGSLGEDGVATTTVSILAPDIRETDAVDGGEWQDRIAKVLLICSWHLPIKWGASNTSINMAESIGFLLGEYMIPSDYPIIYVTDSNNARSLQCNLTNMHNYTHRYNVRHVKQGIDYAIANHFEYLTKRWPRKDQLSPYAMQMYEHAIELCKLWATPATNNDDNSQSLPYTYENEDHDSDEDTIFLWDDSSLSISSVEEINLQANAPVSEKNRNHFDSSMFNDLGRCIIVKVYSHQLNQDFSVNNDGHALVLVKGESILN